MVEVLKAYVEANKRSNLQVKLSIDVTDLSGMLEALQGPNGAEVTHIISQFMH